MTIEKEDILPLTNEKLARAVLWLERGPELLAAAKGAEIVLHALQFETERLSLAIAACEKIGE